MSRVDTSKLGLATLIDIMFSVYDNPYLKTEVIKIVGGSPRDEYQVMLGDKALAEVASSPIKAWQYAVDRLLKEETSVKNS
jgi:hypothetical protein